MQRVNNVVLKYLVVLGVKIIYCALAVPLHEMYFVSVILMTAMFSYFVPFTGQTCQGRKTSD